MMRIAHYTAVCLFLASWAMAEDKTVLNVDFSADKADAAPAVVAAWKSDALNTQPQNIGVSEKNTVTVVEALGAMRSKPLRLTKGEVKPRVPALQLSMQKSFISGGVVRMEWDDMIESYHKYSS